MSPAVVGGLAGGTSTTFWMGGVTTCRLPNFFYLQAGRAGSGCPSVFFRVALDIFSRPPSNGFVGLLLEASLMDSEPVGRFGLA